MTPRRRLTISVLILAGYAVILAGLAGLGWLAVDNVRRMHELTRELYSHPFRVSHAAAEMKGALYQLRNHVLQSVLLPRRGEPFDALCLEAGAFERTARDDLEAIKALFQGDRRQVLDLERALDEWDGIRSAIFAAAGAGDHARAEAMVRGPGSAKFAEIVPLLEYIETFAKDRGRQFADLAEQRSRRLYLNTLALVGAIMAFLLATAGAVFWRVRFLQRELDRQAKYDALTGVANRWHFMAMAGHEVRRSLRYGTPLSLAVVDLDEFKAINDRHGHGVGDLVLQRFSELCRHRLRNSDLIGRIGGEEFALLLPGTVLAEAREVLERLRTDLGAATVATGQGRSIRFTASFGLAAGGQGDLDELLRRADEALYEAKRSGRNQVCIYAE